MRELALIIVFLSWFPWLTAVQAQGTGTTHLYAVIVNGGRNRLTNHERYWNDCAFLYQTLRQTYHVPKRNITVLMSDGGLPYEDMLRDDGRGFISSPEDLDGDGQVSMVEAFEYARSHDRAKETPQYASWPEQLGEQWTFANANSGTLGIREMNSEEMANDKPAGIWTISGIRRQDANTHDVYIERRAGKVRKIVR
jgi:hypothetical protein